MTTRRAAQRKAGDAHIQAYADTLTGPACSHCAGHSTHPFFNVFQCTSCDKTFSILPHDDDDVSDAAASSFWRFIAGLLTIGLIWYLTLATAYLWHEVIVRWYAPVDDDQQWYLTLLMQTYTAPLIAWKVRDIFFPALLRLFGK